MKRNLITAIAIALLYDRQRRVERRVRELRAQQLADNSHLTSLFEEVDEGFRRLAQWQDGFTEEINRAFKEGAR